MGSIDYREVDWSHLETTKEQGEVAKTEAAGLIILTVIVLGFSLFLEPVRNIFLSDAQLLEKYARRFPWLNRCDLSCEQLVDTTLIDIQYQCQTLTRWYYEEGKRDIFAWQLAIDDRATYLGCPGFPKEMKQIKEDVAVREALEVERQEEIQAAREAEQKILEAQKDERYSNIIQSVNLSGFVINIDHPEGSNNIDITVNDNWHNLPSTTRRQYGQSLWRKWVTVHSPNDPANARIRLLNTAGDVVGGSPDGGASPIWVVE